MYIANAGTSRYIKVRMNICTGGLPSANICEEYLHWLLLLEEGSLGLLPLQRLHALQVAGHRALQSPPSAKQASLALARSSHSAALGVASTTGASCWTSSALSWWGMLSCVLGF